MTIPSTVRTRVSGARHICDVAWRTLRRDGTTGVARKAAEALYRRLGGPEEAVGIRPEYIANSNDIRPCKPGLCLPVGQPIRVGWVMTPPARGSGGHTTVFRMVKALEDRGHECTLFLYDVYGGNLARHELNIRTGWPEVRAAVADADQRISGVDVCVATSWESAHVLASQNDGTMKPAYFIQDYEPLFYPMGWEYAMAEDSYRFGFRCIALGAAVQSLLASNVGVESDVIEFGCDTAVYRLIDPARPRAGVVFYARPDCPRRGYQLGRLALEEFHRLYPGQEIHIFGSDSRPWPFPVTRHGRLSPAELNELYNRVIAGVVPSFTNVSLVPEEMLAAGALPVCNESEVARACLKNANVSWTAATPESMARQLGKLVSYPEIQRRAYAVSASVRGRGWESAKRSTVEIIEAEAYGIAHQRV